MLLGNALFQPGVNSGIERDPKDTRFDQSLNQSILDYIAACGHNVRAQG